MLFLFLILAISSSLGTPVKKGENEKRGNDRITVVKF